MNTKARNWQDPFILAFEEPYVDTSHIDSTKRWLRLTVEPAFTDPYCLILERSGKQSILTLKMTDGRGGSYTGYLSFFNSARLPDSVYASASATLRKLNFWNLREDSSCLGGFDGEWWTIEAIEGGRYNLVQRWTPYACGNDTTRQLAALCERLKRKAWFRLFWQTKNTVGLHEEPATR